MLNFHARKKGKHKSITIVIDPEMNQAVRNELFIFNESNEY